MNTMRTLWTGLLCSCLVALCGAAERALGASCAAANCAEVATFTAQVTDFRTSVSGGVRLATATIRFRNKTDRPLALGYVQGSGVLTDDQGNRYEIDGRNGNAVRALGLITRTSYDPKFTLQPGETADARLEFSWYPGRKVAGTIFQMELSAREIDLLAAGQQKLGREHVLQYRGLADGMVAPAEALAVGLASAAAPVAASASMPQDATAAGQQAPATNPCGGALSRCYDAGGFTAQVMQLSSSQQGAVHHVTISLRLRNSGSQPLILAYVTQSGSMIDNYGQRYQIDSRYDAAVKGIGQSSRNKADPQFVLGPGESRNATFDYTRYVGKTPVGTVFTPDLALEQLEILPSRQIRSVREYSVSFSNLTAGATVGDGGEAVNAINSLGEAGKQLSEGLKSLFKKK